MTVLVWFRRDLRLGDNPALHSALQYAEPIVPVYIHDTEEGFAWKPGAASRWYLEQSLRELDKALSAHGHKLILTTGTPEKSLLELAQRTGAKRVLWNRIYEPEWEQRDKIIVNAMRNSEIESEAHHEHSLFPPEKVRNGSGTAYREFSPFWKKIEPRLLHSGPVPGSRRTSLKSGVSAPRSTRELSLAPSEIGLTANQPWHKKLNQFWTAGEAAALNTLSEVLRRLEQYPEQRDLPAVNGTSKLSAALHFGEISPWRIIECLRPAWCGDWGTSAAQGAASLARQLGWREFAIHLLNAFPQSTDHSIRQEFDASGIWTDDADLLQAWQSGRTGFTLVDAGMHQLWETGWMHNRVRMVAASLLTKHLGQHWIHGARWFWDTLVDADLANNTLGWQWVAGSGCDAAPYYRVFNPERQAQRFDSRGEYAHRWLGSLESPYPEIIDLAQTRDQALSRYRHMRGG